MEQFDGYFPGGSGDAENPDEIADGGPFAPPAFAAAGGGRSTPGLREANTKPVLQHQAEEDAGNSDQKSYMAAIQQQESPGRTRNDNMPERTMKVRPLDVG